MVLPPSRLAANKCPLDTCIYSFRISPRKRKNQKEQMLFLVFWSECRDSNSRPLEPHSSAIPNFATPGFCLRLSDDFDMIAHDAEKCKHYFHIFTIIFLAAYSPRSLLTTLPMFHRRTTALSASFISSSSEYSI